MKILTRLRCAYKGHPLNLYYWEHCYENVVYEVCKCGKRRSAIDKTK